jgi:hypothetical protein
MFPARTIWIVAALSLVAATLAVVAHDIRMSAQLGRMLARARSGHAVRLMVKESSASTNQDARARRARRLARFLRSGLQSDPQSLPLAGSRDREHSPLAKTLAGGSDVSRSSGAGVRRPRTDSPGSAGATRLAV